ncbi:hypothetical protein ACIRLA_21990 [Streptomyces sp. NPDC102364]|uniref:hypothetical protein n=1 Tax=Streptomyces sp. NPDC102364 TaxID=3366161 RepID=UPI0037F7E330
MVYYDNSGRRIYRPLRRRPPDPVDPSGRSRYVRKVADEMPGFTPAEVYAWIRYMRRRHDIPKAAVRATLAER